MSYHKNENNSNEDIGHILYFWMTIFFMYTFLFEHKKEHNVRERKILAV